MKMKIILASASPRRQELMKLVCGSFKTVPADIDESIGDGILPMDAAELLARKKAEKVSEDYKNAVVIGCDTAVIVDDILLGKPLDDSDAYKMLALLSGRKHKVVTGVCLRYGEMEESFSAVSEVEFYPLTDEEINEYVETGEPKDKAGAYGIQGEGSLLVKGICGDFFNIVGLPAARLKRELAEFIRKIEENSED